MIRKRTTDLYQKLLCDNKRLELENKELRDTLNEITLYLRSEVEKAKG